MMDQAIKREEGEKRMKTEIDLEGKEIGGIDLRRITASSGKGEPGVQPWENGGNCYKHRIRITVEHRTRSVPASEIASRSTLAAKDYLVKSAYFNYHGSIDEYDNGKDTLNQQDLIDAIQALLEDGLAILQSRDIDDFASNFGYRKVSEALRVWKGCSESLRKLQRLGIGDEAILCDLVNLTSSFRFGPSFGRVCLQQGGRRNPEHA